MIKYLLTSLFFCLLSYDTFGFDLKKLEELSLNAHWQKLLHYKNGIFGSSSNIRRKSFFLNPDGKSDPLKELQATLDGFKSSRGKDINQHPQCRFPARFAWLNKNLKLRVKEYSCPDYRRWTRGDTITSISIIFATGYLGNPASFFGHPMIKFNFKDKKDPISLMDMAINYGAFTPDNVDPISYALNGLLGGYNAGFRHSDFFYSNHNYVETELRNLWEYELNFTKDQVQTIVSHTWELLGVEFPYRFLSYNCATGMAELLELVIDISLLSEKAPYAIPFTLFDNLNRAGHVKEHKLITSRQTRLTSKFKALTNQESDIVEDIIGDNKILQSDRYKSFKNFEKIRVLETLFDYYSFRIIQKSDDVSFGDSKKKVLLARTQLPSGKAYWKPIDLPAPHEWQKSILGRVSYVNNDSLGEGVRLRWKPAYYDLLTPMMGRSLNGALGIFDFEFSYIDKSIHLSHLILLDIMSLNLSQTGLPGDGGMGWQLRLGIEEQNLSCRTCLNPFVQGGAGKAFSPFKSLVFYGMVLSRLQTSKYGAGNIAVIPQLAALLTLSDHVTSHFSIERRYYLDKDRSKEFIYRWENRFVAARSWDFHFTWEKNRAEEFSLSLSLYW